MNPDVEHESPMPDICREYEYRHSWGSIGAVACLGAANIGVMLYILFVEPEWGMIGAIMGPAEMAGYWYVLACGVIVLGMSVRMAIHRFTRPRKISLSETAICAPRFALSSKTVCVPYENVKRIRSIRAMDCLVIRVAHTRGKFVISSAELPRKEDAEEILRVLSEKTGLIPIPSLPWPRQFSLLSLLVVITFAAVALGICRYVYGCLGWGDLCLVLVFIAYGGAVSWLITTAPRSARVFAIGFALGFILETVVFFCIVFYEISKPAPSDRIFEGWYPLWLPVSRMLSSWGWGRGTVTGSAVILSGVVYGTAVLAGWICVRRVTRRRHNRA